MSAATILDLSASPGAAPAPITVLRQALFELKLLLRNGEQLLLAFVIPLALLVGLSSVSWINLGDGRRIDIVVPGILALAITSTAFTSQAISTGFDRRYGVLKLLGATPLSRTRLVAAKTLAILAVEVLQILAICLVAALLGWAPAGNPFGVALLLVLGTAAFSSLGIALAGLLRAEATLAAANAIYLLLLFAGGTVVPIARMPEPMASVVKLLPSGALGGGLRDIMLTGGPVPWQAVAVLLVWTAVGFGIAGRWFKWS